MQQSPKIKAMSEQQKKEAKFSLLENNVRENVNEILSFYLDNKLYEDVKKNNLSRLICENISTYLKENNKRFKYIVNCIIMEKTNQCAMIFDGNAVYNKENDHQFTIQYGQKENQNRNQNENLYACVNVYGLIY